MSITNQTPQFQVRLPKDVVYRSADEEYFYMIGEDGLERRVMLQDYEELYRTPGFYEYLACEHLGYQSPTVLTAALAEQLKRAGQSLEGLSILEIGAGSGLMGKELAALGVASIIGIDILPHAKAAALRDQPGVYASYHVADLARPENLTGLAPNDQQFNCLVCCSALTHLPAAAFANVFNLIAPASWLAFNVLKEQLDDEGPEGFAAKHRWLGDPDVFEIHHQAAYLHRYRTNGSPIDYVAFVGLKKGPIAHAPQ